jgi:hypothetical protein
MKLPNPDRAVIDIEKLRDYCLNLYHPRGRHKARVFASALGLTASEVWDLHNALLAAVITQDAVATALDGYGQRYMLDFTMNGPAGRAIVRSSWIVRHEEDFPRLISCYVL